MGRRRWTNVITAGIVDRRPNFVHSTSNGSRRTIGEVFLAHLLFEMVSSVTRNSQPKLAEIKRNAKNGSPQFLYYWLKEGRDDPASRPFTPAKFEDGRNSVVSDWLPVVGG